MNEWKSGDWRESPAWRRQVRPLPGGLQDLRTRIETETRGRQLLRRRRWAVASVCSVFLTLAILLLTETHLGRLTDGQPRSVETPRPWALVPARGLTDQDLNPRLPDPRIDSSKVVFFWVGALPSDNNSNDKSEIR